MFKKLAALVRRVFTRRIEVVFSVVPEGSVVVATFNIEGLSREQASRAIQSIKPLIEQVKRVGSHAVIIPVNQALDVGLSIASRDEAEALVSAGA